MLIFRKGSTRAMPPTLLLILLCLPDVARAASELDTKEVWITSSIIYLLCVIFLGYCHWENVKVLERTGPLYVLTPLLFSMLFRAIWMFSKAAETDSMIGYKILSRLSTLLQLTSVSFLVYRWFKSTFVPGVGSSGKFVFRFFLILNLIFYVAILATTRSGNEKHEKADLIYRVNSTLLSFCFVVISIATIVYGNRLKKIIKGTNNEDIISVALPKIAAVSWSLFVCFFLRAICYTYTPVTGQYETPSDGLDSVMYPILFYQLPEIVPAIVVGWSMLSDRNEMGLKQRWLRLWRSLPFRGLLGGRNAEEMDIVIDDEIGIRGTEVENRIKFGGTG